MKKQRNILIAVVLTIFVMNIIVPSSVFISFKVNQEYISKTICIEKDLEVNTCQGSCHLKKQLKKVQQSNSEDDTVELPNTRLTSLFCNHFSYSYSIKKVTKRINKNNHFYYISGGYPDCLIKPPIA